MTDTALGQYLRENKSSSHYDTVGFWCPACAEHHSFTVKSHDGGTRPMWSFNGDIEKPTFTPSLRCLRGERGKTHENTEWVTTCHTNITAGKIIYHGDCPHAMAGMTIDMVPHPWSAREQRMSDAAGPTIPPSIEDIVDAVVDAIEEPLLETDLTDWIEPPPPKPTPAQPLTWREARRQRQDRGR